MLAGHCEGWLNLVNASSSLGSAREASDAVRPWFCLFRVGILSTSQASKLEGAYRFSRSSLTNILSSLAYSILHDTRVRSVERTNHRAKRCVRNFLKLLKSLCIITYEPFRR